MAASAEHTSNGATGDVEPDVFVETAGAKYRCQTLKDMERFKEFCLNNEGWTEKHKSAKVSCYTKPPPNGGSFNIVKVVSIFPTLPPSLIYDCMHDADYRSTWDANMIEGYNITQLDPHNDIGYYSCTFPFPLAKRDFCNQRYWMEFTNGDYIIANFSVPHAQAPVKKDFVRALSMNSGYFLMPEGPGTKLVYVSHSDPKGSIPSSVMNFTLAKLAPSIMGKLETNAEKYIQWLSDNRPPDFVPKWRTPKVSWNRAENAAAARAAAAPPLREAPAGSNQPSLIRPGALPRADDDDVEGGDRADGASPPSKDVLKLQQEIEELKRQLGASGTSHGAAHYADPMHSLAPVGPRVNDDTRAVQQYRAAMQGALDFVDRQYLQEGRAPASMSEYLTRLRHVVEGIRRTVP